MRHSVLIIAGLFFAAAPLAATGETPDVQPGEWDFTTIIDMRGGQAMPEQSHSTRRCITEEDLADAESTFLDDVGDCNVMDSSIAADSMDFTMTCDHQGMHANVTGEYSFLGDTVEGNMVFNMDPAVGLADGPGAGPGTGDEADDESGMRILTEIRGERIGDC